MMAAVPTAHTSTTAEQAAMTIGCRRGFETESVGVFMVLGGK